LEPQISAELKRSAWQKNSVCVLDDSILPALLLHIAADVLHVLVELHACHLKGMHVNGVHMAGDEGKDVR
jgi:hypothetical protein